MIDDLYALSDHLATRRLGRRLVLLDQVGSTNDEAARLAGEGAEDGTVVIADTQTRGRGRLGRSWASPPASGLYLSVLLRPAPLEPGRAWLVVFAAAVATADAARCAVGRDEVARRLCLRWPNDVVAISKAGATGRHRKLAGILTELATRGGEIDRLIVGIGINVAQGVLPPELAGEATSLEALAGHPVDRALVAAELLDRLERWVDRLIEQPSAAPAELLAAWRARAVGLGQPVEIRRDLAGTDVVRGIAETVDDAGALWILTPAGERVRVLTGDVRLLVQS